MNVCFQNYWTLGSTRRKRKTTDALIRKGDVNKYHPRWHKTREYIITLIWKALLWSPPGSGLVIMQLGFSLEALVCPGSGFLSGFDLVLIWLSFDCDLLAVDLSLINH